MLENRCTVCGSKTTVITTIRRAGKTRSNYCTNCFHEEPVEEAAEIVEQPRLEIDED